MKKDNIAVKGHMGTWYIIDKKEYKGKMLYLLEHEAHGGDAPSVIINDDFELMLEDVHNGFNDYEEYVEGRDYWTEVLDKKIKECFKEYYMIIIDSLVDVKAITEKYKIHYIDEKVIIIENK